MRAAYRRKSSRVPALLLAFGLALAGVAAPPAARAADDTTRAKAHFQEGTTLFNVGEFDKAIEAWQEGYKEKPDPGFLYNIGQAYRLKGDNAKAIFFYRGYLRNSPKAPNRDDVEAKIEQLQKATPATPAPVTTPPPPPSPAPVPAPTPIAPAPAPVRPTPVAPPPVEAPPIPEPMGPPSVELGPAPAAPEAPSSPSTPADARGVDLDAALGFDAWTSGVRSDKVPPTFAFAVEGGYSLGGGARGTEFRVGGYLGVTSLSETLPTGSNKLSFTTILIEPSVRSRLIPDRLYVTWGLGLGGVAIGGLKPSSVLFAPGTVKAVNGAQGAFTWRPSAAIQLQLTQGLLVAVEPSFLLSPKKANYYQAIDRFELMFGLGYRL